MGRLPKASADLIGLGRVDTQALASDQTASTAMAAANAMSQISSQMQNLEAQKQEALLTIDLNKAHAELTRDAQALQQDIERNYADDPEKAEQIFNERFSTMKASYEEGFKGNELTQARFSGVGESADMTARARFTSWKSGQEVINATKSYRATQAARLETAGGANNLAELAEVLHQMDVDVENTKGIFNGTQFDAVEDTRKAKADAVKQFLFGQLDKSPGSIDAYLNDDMVKANLSEDDVIQFKREAKNTIKSNLRDAEEESAISNLYDYYDTYEGILNGTVTAGQLTSKIAAMVASGASPERVGQWMALKNQLVTSDITASQAADKAAKAANNKVRAEEAMLDVTTMYYNLYGEKGNQTAGVPVEESAKLLSKITEYKAAGLLTGDQASSMRQKAMLSVTQALNSDSKVYKTKKAKAQNEGNVPNWLGHGDIDVPVDEYNRGLKVIMDGVSKMFPGKNVAGGSVKALAVSDYIANYDKYKKLGMTDKEIRNSVVTAAVRTQRGNVQQAIDVMYQSTSTSGKYTNLINNAASQYNVPAKLINSIIHAESGYNARAKSPDGAQGLMQLMPRTAKGLGVTNPYDPAQNINGGTKHIAGLLAKYGGNMRSAVAAYNAGGGTVDDFLHGTNKTGKNPSHARTKDGVPPFKETQNYVARVLGGSGGGNAPKTAKDADADSTRKRLKNTGKYSDAEISEYIKQKGLS